MTPETERFIRVAGRNDLPVLLTGETGVGKTTVAGEIHKSSTRSKAPFIHVNCAAIPEGLFEREMFGHVRGAFTDAREDRAGLIAMASGGTLFLDEIAEIPTPMQAKLLTVLESGRFRKVGAPVEHAVDVRIISASNQDLSSRIRAGAFREDLYHRIAVLRHAIPSLSTRREELRSLILELSSEIDTGNTAIPEEVIAQLLAYDWPGNVRELRNVLLHAAAWAEGGPITTACLPRELRAPRMTRRTPEEPRTRYRASGSEEVECARIERALIEAQGCRSRAARALGMSRATLWAKIIRFGLESTLQSASLSEHV